MGDLFVVVINAMLYVVLFVLRLQLNRKIGVSEILLSIYVVVAFFCVIHFLESPSAWNLSLFNLVYLFLVFCIFFVPVMSDEKNEVKECPLIYYSIYKKVGWLYIILSLYSCVVYIPQVYLALTNPNWAEIYEEAHDVIEGNIYTKLANLFFHLRYLGMILFFSFLTRKEEKKLFVVLMGVSAFLPVVLVAMLQASRGGMVALAISIALSFRMFSPAVPKNVVRSMYKLALVIIPLMVVYFIAVSVSRFEEAKQGDFDSAESSYVMYLGESMLYFDDGVMNGVTEYAEGGYLFDIPEKISQIKGDHFGVHFMTFIGCLYLDFGPYGTLIYALLVAAYWRLFMQKKRKGIPELFFLLTYLMYLFNGVFVMGYGYGIQWIEAIFIYIALRVAELIYRKIYKVEEDELGVESAKLLS